MQQMVCPNSDCMKKVFVDFVRESVYEVHPSLWQSMQWDLIKTVMLYKEKDVKLNQEQQRAATATSSTTTLMEACGSASVLQQPHKQLWWYTMANPGSVWGSMDTGYVQPQQLIESSTAASVCAHATTTRDPEAAGVTICVGYFSEHPGSA